ncbi:hypothetical protein PGQ11_001874 [Apiospora arundinis]|uniref:Uncharacterized protein n=1 Tax=Apiospora arundinis TaxID=335852 RepID=A0ABR2JGF4_9PEZI
MENGLCIIGIEQSAMIGPVAIDVACNGSNIALPTVASNNTRIRNERLLRVARKSFVGCFLTLSSSIA